jgi:hypothetical protein
MEMKLGKITVGKATKHTKAKMDMRKICALYKAGKCVAEIAREIGFPPNVGQNRTRRVLQQAGIYRATYPKKRAAKKAKAA